MRKPLCLVSWRQVVPNEKINRSDAEDLEDRNRWDFLRQ